MHSSSPRGPQAPPLPRQRLSASSALGVGACSQVPRKDTRPWGELALGQGLCLPASASPQRGVQLPFSVSLRFGNEVLRPVKRPLSPSQTLNTQHQSPISSGTSNPLSTEQLRGALQSTCHSGFRDKCQFTSLLPELWPRWSFGSS